ncbi:MAG TPA: hypothetical protein VKZ63_07170 [Kofleriaceae bacterium]|nr:hypothetical protein [Kofleriaceae bacterium]
MKTTRWKMGGALAVALAASACGDDLISAEREQFLAVCGENQRPGTACTWLGVPGQDGFTPDGAHRLDTMVSMSMDILFHSSGEVWFHDWNNHLVRRVLLDDTVETMVGWTDPIFPGDGVPGDPGAEKRPGGAPGVEVRLNHPTDFAEDADGTVLLMAWHNHKLRRIDPETGTVTIDCGGGGGFAGDGGPAEQALFKQPNKLARAADGTLYITDQQNQRVRRIAPDGVISTVAGNGTAGFAGDGGPATEAMIACEIGSNPAPTCGVAVDGERLYISDTLNHRIRVVDLETGIIDTLAGDGEPGYAGDGGAAAAARFSYPQDLEIGPDGDLYIADTNNSVIRAIDLDSGTVRTVAGTGELGLGEEGLPARQTALRRPWGVEFDPDGNLYIMDSLNHRIVKVLR